MKIRKSVLSVFLTLALCLSMMAMACAADTADSGVISGSNYAWTLDQSGCLTISGSGNALVFSSEEDQPWADCRDRITEVWFDGFSSMRIPDLAYWFDGCTNLVFAEIPSTVQRIGTRAFADCPRLATVALHYTTEPYTVAEDAFYLDAATGTELRFSFQIGFPEMVEPLASYPWAASSRTKLLFGRAPSNGLLSLSGNEQAVVIGNCPQCGEYSLQGEYTTESHPHRDYNQCYKCGYTEYTGTTSTKDHGDGSYGSWTCPKCGDHTWVLESEEPATCTQNGSRTYSCYCGQTKTETVYASGHDYTYGGWEYEDETQHVRTGTCDVCGRSSTQHQDHTWTYGSWDPADAAQHKRSRSCAACSHTEYEYGSHTDGNDDGVCDVCGFALPQTDFFCVTVPAVLPIVMGENGNIHTASAYIRNESSASVKIDSVMILAEGGWTIVPFRTDMAHEKVDANRIGFQLFGVDTMQTGVSEQLTLNDTWQIGKDAVLELRYDAVVSALSAAVSGQPVLRVVFVFFVGVSMQEELESRTVMLAVSTTKLTARVLKDAMAAYLRYTKQKSSERRADRSVRPRGKQSVKQLTQQNQGVSSIDVTDDNIRSFERIARKYGVDYAVKKDRTTDPPRYMIFFKSRDADALNAAFREYSAKSIRKEERPSVRVKLRSIREQLKGRSPDKTRNKIKELER